MSNQEQDRVAKQNRLFDIERLASKLQNHTEILWLLEKDGNWSLIVDLNAVRFCNIDLLFLYPDDMLELKNSMRQRCRNRISALEKEFEQLEGTKQWKKYLH